MGSSDPAGNPFPEVAVLRGSTGAKIDDRGRLKVPADFRRILEDKYGYQMFVTSYDARSVRIYPFPVWHEIELRMEKLPSTHPTRRRFSLQVNSHGAQTTMDKQGRILIPDKLRQLAKVDEKADVRVIGQQNYLDVWNEDLLKKTLEQPLSEEDLKTLADLGI